jgi:DnaK suppressor protein
MPQKRRSKSAPSRRAPAPQTRSPRKSAAGSRDRNASRSKPAPARASRLPQARAAEQPIARPARPPRPMAPGRYELYTRLLLEERNRLRQELSEMEEHQVRTEEKPIADVSGYEDDLVDVATETFEREKGLALESTVQGMLQMVEEALQKIRQRTYGVCEGCGQSIDANRLRAIPYARLCIRCKEREERLRSVAR